MNRTKSNNKIKIDLNRVFWILAFVIITKAQDVPNAISYSKRSIFSEPTKAIPGPEKGYTGIRLKHDTFLVIYHHGQTVAVVEVTSNREMFSCELLEVRTEADKLVTLNSLKSLIPNQFKIGFSYMMKLMNQCQMLDYFGILDRKFVNERTGEDSRLNPRELTSILSGVFPGTKWCGSGDLAGSYYDLGTDRELDKCCRTHDFCPIKVAGLKTQYNITNYSIYTKSHCECDEHFYNCLKTVDSVVSNFVGHLYFNIAKFMCVEDIPPNDPEIIFADKRFVRPSKRY